ncbi:MAG: J domain-containing protein [Ilumatobacteraceae bacterium]
MTDHYATLGVSRTASHEQIRRAYRERMRAAHPDSSGERSSGASRPSGSAAAEVTRIAEAWDVLSSPTRRAAYDLQLASGSAAGARSTVSGSGTTSPRMQGTFDYEPQPDRVYPPARFPWRFVLITIGIGTAIILFLHLVGDRTPPRTIDGLITSGSCVDFDNVGAAFEVSCDGPHQAVVRELVPFDSACDSDTTQARDRQGMGTVCIEP